MGNGNSQPDASLHRLDADAFCVICSSVNPEGTLICKTCGNNLRDQKAQRVAGTLAVDVPMMEPEKTAWLPKALVILGILLVFWTAWNLSDIADWLVGAEAADLDLAQYYWEGANSAVLNEMAQELEANPLKREEKEAAQAAVEAGQSPASGTYEGHYLLLRSGGIPGELGEAVVKQVDNERVLFVARVNRGRAELRGEGVFGGGGSRLDSRDMAAIKINGRPYGADGFVSFGGGPLFECYGTCDLNEETYSAVALRVR